MPDLAGDAGRLDVVARYVLEEILQVDFLLVVRAERRASLLADDRDDWNVVGLGVVETRQQMDRTWTRGRVAKSDPTGELGMGRCHEGRHLLVANLHILHLVLGFLERHVETADTVAGIAVDPRQVPLDEALPDEFAYVHDRCLAAEMKDDCALEAPTRGATRTA